MEQLPIQMVPPLLQWYHTHARELPWRGAPTPYAVWVSEIMLQQTRVEAVRGYFARFLAALPTISDLAEAREETLLKLWEGLGYYSRARNLQKAARILVESYGGQLPASFAELCKLPGIGEYTAGAIASIAFGEPVPAIDGNALRVWSRLLAEEQDITKAACKRECFRQFQEVIPPDQPGDFNQAIMDLGATVCTPHGQPHCGSCPVSAFCTAYALGIAASLPVKPEKKPRRIENRTVFLLWKEDRIALRQRENQGLLAGLWEFPQVEGHLSPKAAKQQIAQWGYAAGVLQRAPAHTHIFSHVEWHMWAYSAQITGGDPQVDFQWASKQEFHHQFPLPSAFQPWAANLPWKE